ncbi:MAG: CBS domain-containing protein, partial [Desulfobacteria bacterium]
EAAIARLRAESPNLDIIDYIYVLNEENVLQGVVSIRDIFAAKSRQPLSEIEVPRLVSVKVDTDQDEVVKLFMKYGFRALPVVDKDNCLKGVIGFRSVLDVLSHDRG